MRCDESKKVQSDKKMMIFIGLIIVPVNALIIWQKSIALSEI